MHDLSLVKKKFIDYIDEIVMNDRVSHAYLIEVDSFEKDSSYIFSFIKMILSNMTYNEVFDCNNKIFELIDSNKFPDIYVISSDTNVINKSKLIELQSDFKNKSLYGDKRFYIIMDSEKMNSSSANTILKFLEEPENNIYAFLVTDSRFHVLETIRSRCQILSLRENNFDLIFDDSFIDFLDCVLNPSKYFINYKFFSNYLTDKNFAFTIFNNVENYIVFYLESKFSNSIFNDNVLDILSKKSDCFLINIISIVEEYLPKLKFNVNFKLWLDSLFSSLIGGCYD